MKTIEMRHDPAWVFESYALPTEQPLYFDNHGNQISEEEFHATPGKSKGRTAAKTSIKSGRGK